MPTKISGLPAHILLVHLVIVLVPVAAALVIVAGVWPAARRWLNWLPALAALAALICVPITTNAGHWLEDHLTGTVTAAIAHHAALGEQMLPWTIALFVASLVVWALARAEGLRTMAVGRGARGSGLSAADVGRKRSTRGGRLNGRLVKLVVAVIAIVAAVGAIQQVYRTGEAGSRAVWSGSFRG